MAGMLSGLVFYHPVLRVRAQGSVLHQGHRLHRPDRWSEQLLRHHAGSLRCHWRPGQPLLRCRQDDQGTAGAHPGDGRERRIPRARKAVDGAHQARRAGCGNRRRSPAGTGKTRRASAGFSCRRVTVGAAVGAHTYTRNRAPSGIQKAHRAGCRIDKGKMQMTKHLLIVEDDRSRQEPDRFSEVYGYTTDLASGRPVGIEHGR